MSSVENSIVNLRYYVSRLAFKYCRDVEEAEDITQDVMYNALKSARFLREDSDIKGWLSVITKNIFINYYHKEKRQGGEMVRYDDIENFYEFVNFDTVKCQHIVLDSFSNTLSDETVDALNSLPDNYRTVIILRDLENYSYEEMSDFVGIPIGTIRSTLHRARATLYYSLHNFAKSEGYLQQEYSST